MSTTRRGSGRSRTQSQKKKERTKGGWPKGDRPAASEREELIECADRALERVWREGIRVLRGDSPTPRTHVVVAFDAPGRPPPFVAPRDRVRDVLFAQGMLVVGLEDTLREIGAHAADDGVRFPLIVVLLDGWCYCSWIEAVSYLLSPGGEA